MGGELLMGLEEELMVLDASTLALSPHDLPATWARWPARRERMGREMHRATLELRTDIARHPDALLRAATEQRQWAIEAAEAQGQCVALAGLHPTASPFAQAVHADEPHYATLLNGYGDVACGACTFGLHLHLGLPTAEARWRLFQLLRERLPMAQALAANAPFSEGRDTALASFRASWLGRYPRMGIPEPLPHAEAAAHQLERLRRTGCVPLDGAPWYDLRLHHRLPTVELRVADALGDLHSVWRLAAWAACWAWTVAEGGAAAQLPAPTATDLLQENHWRARRHGAQAQLVDWQRDTVEGLPTWLEREAEALAPAAKALGLGSRLRDALQAAPGADGAQWQRQQHATGGFNGLLQALVAQARRPWHGE
jgi:glutamate---cysteine ligase / carboxylate-amine ligase